MAALRAAAEAGVAVMLLSPPGAARSMGAAVFQAMIAEARGQFPGVDAVAVLDSADEPGAAMRALRHGSEAIRLVAAPEIVSKINAMAAQVESILEPGGIPSLDLGTVEDILAACRKWLTYQ